tara:strand:+ start:87 stop:473 length:387 start_codon:yes stop_codon:yes gene_type:complete
MIYNKENLEIVSKAIVDNLTPDLIPKKWQQRNSITPSFGHCHNASACLQKVFGTKNIKLYRALDEQDIWHWWCIDIDGNRIDLTSDQYYKWNRTPPYEQGEKASILGWGYKKRVVELLKRVEKVLDIK